MRKLALLASWAIVLGMSGMSRADEPAAGAKRTAKPGTTVPAPRVVPAVPKGATKSATTETPAGKATSALFRAIGEALSPSAAPAATPAAAPAVIALDGVAPDALQVAPPEATHQLFKAVKVSGERGATLQTLAATSEGNVVCLIGPSRYAPVGQSESPTAPKSEVRMFDRDGKELRRWSVAFTGQSVAVGPGGEIFVAGDGRVAKFSADGKLDVETEIPHIQELLKDNKSLEQQARDQNKSTLESYEETIRNMKQQIEAIEKSAKEGGTARNAANPTGDRRQELMLLKAQVQAYENALQSVKNQDLKNTIRSITSRMRVINGLSVTEKEVYVMCGETKGYGYSLWRMNLALTKSEKVLSRLSGCCGQMDVQVRGDQIVIAENTRHRVARYGLDGTLADSFGARSRESIGAKFGGCCNPMNCRIMDNGDIYTAESEGVIKKFNAQGEFVALIGVVRLTGGCKNVAVAATPQGERVFFCDQPGSQFVILEAKPAAETAAGGS